MRGSRTTTTTLILTGAFGIGSLVGLAAPALADTPAHQGTPMVLSLPGDTDPKPGDQIAIPTPAPKPEAPKDKAPAPQPPEPKPAPNADLPIAQPANDPQPEAPKDKVGPQKPAQPNPGVGDGPDEIADNPGCTHGCSPEPDCAPVHQCGPTDLADRPADPGDEPADGDEPTDGSTDVEAAASAGSEVLSSSTDRGALPRTGAGLALLAAAGASLTGFGVALRKAVRR